MAWTNEQQLAIDQRDKNILVAAAAGSGKTAVLVERIKKLILEEGVPIDRMLIVTFTNAAAAEMKEKIRKVLTEEIDRAPEESAKLRHQLSLLPRANISTFHAFALDVIRRFFYQAEVEPGFSICDDAQRTILKEDSLDLLLENRFATDEEEFYDFLNWYSGDRNQNKIREIIDSAYNVLQSLPYPWKWLSEKTVMLGLSAEELAKSELMDYIWNFIDESADEALGYAKRAADILNEAGLSRMAEKVEEEEVCYYEEVCSLAEDRRFQQLGEHLQQMPSLRLTAKKDEKEDYGQIKAQVAACRSRAKGLAQEMSKTFFISSFEEQTAELNQTAPMARTLQKLLLEFDSIFRAAKAEKKLVDFNDIEHFCLEILQEDGAAAFYRNKFQYIFIDEYQDTNILQEEIISKIKRGNNLFMVGDIKQSIYKFRLAEPEIFKTKYAAYSSGDEHSMKIDLNRNFRSKPVILNEINRIFDGLMEDYDEDAMLYPGLSYDGQYSYLPQIRVVNTKTAQVDETLAELKNTELEALEVCRIVKENLGRKFYDHKAGIEREIRPRDIVILMRGVRNYADVFYNALKQSGIESFVDESEGYFDTMEIAVFMNLLSVIDNRQQDVPLISVLHSEIFGFSVKELGRIRSWHKEGSYAECFMRYASEDDPRARKDESLRERCRSALKNLKTWKAMSGSMPLGRFIWTLLLETGYYLKMGAMPAGVQRQANLRALVDKAESFGRDRQSSLYSFVRYIDAVKERKVPMGQVKLVGENDDLVRIMTIHKSKGLEFPMVILSGAGRRLNYTRLGRGISLHKDIGVAMTLVDFEGHWYRQTLLQRLMQKQVHREEVQEEIRILYVALTRAKDILYVTGTVKDGDKFLEAKESGLRGDSTYLDMLLNASSLQLTDCSELSAVDLQSYDYGGNPMDRDIYEGQPSAQLAAELEKRLSFVYPYESSRKMKSKYSVTELNDSTEKKHHFSTDLAVPKFRQGEKVLTAAEKGTIYHGIMERLDFYKAMAEGEAYIEEAVKAMADAEIFTEEETAAVDLRRVADFFGTDLGGRCARAFAAGKLQRERPFNLKMELQGETVIVQGIIDCYFEEEDGLVLVDYKSSFMDISKGFAEEKERLRRTYEKQIEIYKRALTASGGRPVKEAYLYLLGAGCEIRM